MKNRKGPDPGNPKEADPDPERWFSDWFMGPCFAITKK
jgi:hypothetical protein